MKKLLSLFSILLVSVMLFSCVKTEHSIRIANQYSTALRITIGPNNYGLVGSGSTTGYSTIPEGSHTISGDVNGTVSVSGKGVHKWTLTITSAGTTSIKEDK